MTPNIFSDTRVRTRIIVHMARGWESKSVEAQQSEAQAESSNLRHKLSPKEAAAVRERENLRLSRRRVIQQLEASSNPQQKKMLEDALAELDQKLSGSEK